MKIKDFEIMDFNKDEEMSIEEEISSKDEEIVKEEPEGWKKELLSWVLTLGITMLVVLFVKNFIIINASVPTGSMENTIMPGDNLMGFRLAYLLEEPERGDVIFFYFPDDERQKYVKRIIGLPGESVLIVQGEIYINGSSTPLEEDYLKEKWIIGTGTYEFQVPEDSYLVLGDNRNNSQDARYWINPYVAKEKIIGKALFTYYPFDRWGTIE